MEFTNGQPCWVDVMVKDATTQQRFTTFFTDLFGLRWEVGGPETGFYGMGFLDDRAVMAIGQNEHGAGFLSVYLHCDDLDATVAAVTAAGGSVFMGPMDVMEAGRLALAMDPAGAVVGLWQGQLMPGFGVMDAPGAFTWFDNMSTDPELAQAFYCSAFGLEFEPMGSGGILKRGDRWFASISKAEHDSPSFWNPIFLTPDVDATEARARELGCQVLMSRMPVPGGLASAVAHSGLGLTVTFFQATEPAH